MRTRFGQAHERGPAGRARRAPAATDDDAGQVHASADDGPATAATLDAVLARARRRSSSPTARRAPRCSTPTTGVGRARATSTSSIERVGAASRRVVTTSRRCTARAARAGRDARSPPTTRRSWRSCSTPTAVATNSPTSPSGSSASRSSTSAPVALRLDLERRDPAATRSALIARLRDHLRAEIARWELNFVYEQIELPLVMVLGRMEARGIRVDVELLRTIAKEFTEEAASLDAADPKGRRTRVQGQLAPAAPDRALRRAGPHRRSRRSSRATPPTPRASRRSRTSTGSSR